MDEMKFLPLTVEEMRERGWDGVDAVCVTGDAYVDHPSFGIAIISRLIESMGQRVAIIAQPDIRDKNWMKRFGRPRLGFFVASGNVDSMVSNYTAAKRKRSDDAYSPGGRAGGRPDRALTVYCRMIREAYPEVPLVIGGLEGSLRRFAHYDYWADTVMPSILVDTGADILIYGMGEHQTAEIVRRLAAGEPVSAMTDIRGTCFMTDAADIGSGRFPGAVSCASFEKVRDDKLAYAKACKAQMDEQDAVYGRTILQKHGGRLLVQNPPALPLERDELDRVYAMKYMRMYHPSYEKFGGVPAIKEVEFSIVHNRGCFGACNFCAIAAHQGRYVTSRSADSVVEEARLLSKSPRFKGYIHDVGGPTANFRYPACGRAKKYGVCKGKKCLAPKPCPSLVANEKEYLGILRRIRELPGIKKVFIRSGIRFDYLLEDKDESFFRELVEHHISGQLKVAPEHCSPEVLDRMGKPHIETYDRFAKRFYELTKSIGKEQYLVPYLISSHPGSTLSDAIRLAEYMKRNRIRPEQVQDFYPTPMTDSTCMYYTGLDPNTLKPVYVAKTPEEKAEQRALLQYFMPANREIVARALRKAGRTDLIGDSPKCLIPSDRRAAAYSGEKGKTQTEGKVTNRRSNEKKRTQTSGDNGHKRDGDNRRSGNVRATGASRTAEKTRRS